MAITKTIEIDLNSQGATTGINNITNSIEQTDKATQSLRSQLRQAQADVGELSEKFGATSKEAVEAAKRAGQLKDAIGDAKALTDAFNPDAKFSALSGSLSGVASGFSAVEGSLALAGVQSENLQETMVRLQAAMALSQGLQGLGESIDSFKQMGAVAKNALAGIKTGIAATGIGILLVAIGAIAVYWDDIKEAVGGVSTEQESLNKLSQKNLDTEQSKLDSFSLQENSLKLQGKSEKDILKMKISQTDQIIKASEIQIEQSIATTKAQTEAAKRNQDILAGVLKFISLPLTMILKTVDAVGSALGKDFGLEEKVFKGLSSFIFDPKKTQAEGDKVVAEQKKALEKLKSDKDGLQLSINNIDKQANTEAAAKRKEANDKANEDAKAAKEKAIELEKEKADALERIRQGEIDTEAERRAEELRQVQEQYKLLIAEAEKYYGENSAKVLSLKEAQRTKEKELADKFKAEDDQKELDYWMNQSAKSIARDDEAKKKRETAAAEDIAFQKAKDDVIATSKANFNNIISGLEETGLAKTKAGQGVAKAIALTQIGIDSAVAISKASTLANAEGVAAQLALPFVPGIGTVARIISYASTGLSVLSNVKRAKQLLSSGGSAGGSASGGGGSAPSIGGGGSPPAPQFNVVGNTGVNQLAQTLGSQQPVQAFVVANQVTSQQSLDRNIIKNASLG
jgi:hypothetical protein